MAWNMFFLNPPTNTLEWTFIVAMAAMFACYVVTGIVRIFSDKVADRMVLITMVPGLVVCGCIAVALFTK